MIKLTIKRIVAVRLSGGLGNQLFQLFAGYAATKASGGNYLYLDCSSLKSYKTKRNLEIKFILNYLDDVEFIYDIPLYIKILFKLRVARIFNSNILNFSFVSTPDKFMRINFKDASILLLDGYFQDPEIFKNCIIRSVLFNKFNNKYSDVLSIYRDSGFELVGMHIRRGDYLKSKEAKIYKIINFDYYDAAVASLKINVNSTRVLIFSDDKEVGLIAAKRYNAIYVDSSSIRLDEEFILLSMCDTIIGANSTFSWWAAYLFMSANKTIYFPANWYLDQKKNLDNKLLINEFQKI